MEHEQFLAELEREDAKGDHLDSAGKRTCVRFEHSSLEMHQLRLPSLSDGCANPSNDSACFHFPAMWCPSSVARTFGNF